MVLENGKHARGPTHVTLPWRTSVSRMKVMVSAAWSLRPCGRTDAAAAGSAGSAGGREREEMGRRCGRQWRWAEARLAGEVGLAALLAVDEHDHVGDGELLGLREGAGTRGGGGCVG